MPAQAPPTQTESTSVAADSRDGAEQSFRSIENAPDVIRNARRAGDLVGSKVHEKCTELERIGRTPTQAVDSMDS